MTVEKKARKLREQGVQIMTAKEKVEYDATMKRIKEEQDYAEAIIELFKRVENLENEIIALKRG